MRLRNKSRLSATNRIGRFARDEAGSSTIEAVLWLPILFWVMILVVDVSFIFNGRAEAFRVIQNGNRAYSVGQLTSDEETQSFIQRALSSISPNVAVTTVSENGIISTDVTIPASDLMVIHSMPGLSNLELVIHSQHFVEL